MYIRVSVVCLRRIRYAEDDSIDGGSFARHSKHIHIELNHIQKSTESIRSPIKVREHFVQECMLS